MNAGATRRRIPAVILWGALAVLMWAAFTAFFNGGEARADDEKPSPLSGLSSLVGAAVTEVVDPVAETAVDAVTVISEPVVNTTKTVVEKTTSAVAKVPVVGKPASDALGATSKTVSTVTNTVTKAVANDPVSSIVKPVTGVVRDVPVVGSALDDLGVTDLLDDSAGTVDGVVDTLVPVVDNTLPPVVDALDPQVPGEDSTVDRDTGVTEQPAADDVTSAGPSITSPAPSKASTDAVASFDSIPTAWTQATLMASIGAATASDSNVSDDAPRDPATGAPFAMAPSSSSAGPGGSSGGTNAALPHHHVHADGAWTLAGIPADSVLPPSPAGNTDVSPD